MRLHLLDAARVMHFCQELLCSKDLLLENLTMKANPILLLAVVLVCLLQVGCASKVAEQRRRLTGPPTMSTAEAIQTITEWRAVNGHIFGNRVNNNLDVIVLEFQSVSDTKLTYLWLTKKPIDSKTETEHHISFLREVPSSKTTTTTTHFVLEKMPYELDFSRIRKVINTVAKDKNNQPVKNVIMSGGWDRYYWFYCSSPEWVERMTQAFLVLCPNAR